MITEKHNQSLTLLVLIGCAFLLVLTRLHTYHEPLERDFAIYSLVAHDLLQGKVLYAETWDIKPPAIYLTYAAAEWLVGFGKQSIFLLNILAAIISLFGIYFVATHLAKNRAAGLWASLFWVLISNDLYLQANQPNAEVFMNACFIWAFGLLWRLRSAFDWRQAVFIGLLFALASTYKQPAIFFAILLSIAYLIWPADKTRWITAVGHVAIMGLVGFLVWMGIFAYFAAMGHFQIFYETNFLFVRDYSGNLWQNFQSIWQWENLVPDYFHLALPMTILPIIALIIGIVNQKRAPVFLIFYALAILIMISLPQQYFPHYYQFWLPWLAVANGWALIEISQLLQQYINKWALEVRNFLAVGVFLVLLFMQMPHYFLSAQEWSYRKYGTLFIMSQALAQEIDQVLPPRETFYQWGVESQLHFYTQRWHVNSVFHLMFVRKPEQLKEKFMQRTLRELQLNPPKLIILPLVFQVPEDNRIIQWIKANYYPDPNNERRVRIYRKAALDFIKKVHSKYPQLKPEDLVFPVFPPLPPLGFYWRQEENFEVYLTQHSINF